MPAGLFALEAIPRRLNHDKLLDILLLLAETGTSTFYERVERVLPGQTLVVTANAHRLQPYWRLEDVPPLVLGRDAEYQEAFEATFREAVRCRLRSDAGPVAAQLSGGWDSSSVTALAAEELAGQERRLIAITAAPPAGFRGTVPRGCFVDEDRYAALTAAGYGNVEHVVLRGEPGLLYDLDAFTRAAEIPVLNLCNQRWLMALFRAAHDRGARVVLSARGGNMTISYRGLYRLSELARSGRWLALAGELRALRARPGATWRTGLRTALEPLIPGFPFRGEARSAAAYRRLARHAAFDPSRYPRPVVEARARACGWDHTGPRWPDGRAMRVGGLSRIDEAPFNAGFAAVTGVQPVDPTLDRRVVELCLSIPDTQFFRDGEDRRLLRRMMANRLPPELMNDSRKGLQGADWFEALRADRDAIADELELCARSATAACVLDLASLRSDLRSLPDEGWEQPATVARFRMRLLRGVAMAGFIRRVEAAPAPAEGAPAGQATAG
jgi:asparagine synthase (glutamine-hydrolysing)